jgi:hypothetical protein
MPRMTKRPQQRTGRAAVNKPSRLRRTGFWRTPVGFALPAGLGLKKWLPAITSCRHMSRLRMLQSAWITAIWVNAHYRLHRLGLHPVRGPLLLLQAGLFTGSFLAHRGRLPRFFKLLINWRKIGFVLHNYNYRLQTCT